MTNKEKIEVNNELIRQNNIKLTTALNKIATIPTPLDTSDATATSNDIKTGKTAYVNGNKITGTHEEATPTLQSKSITITENGTQTVTADAGNDGLSSVEITTNVASSGGGIEEYISQTATNYQGASTMTGALKAIIKIPKMPPISGTSLTYSFYRFSAVTEIGTETFENWDTSNVTDMSYMFRYCTSLKKLDLSTFNTNKVTNWQYMFANCTKLEEVNLKNFKKPTANYSNMFLSVPTTVKIITNSSFAEFLQTSYSSYTNIEIVQADWE